MKNKIYKVLGIVLSMAIIMTTCLCAFTVAHAEGTVKLAQGTIDNGVVKPASTNRLHFEESLLLSDYESVTIAADYKIWYHFYDAEQNYLGGSGAWITGPTTTAVTKTGAVYFNASIGRIDNADITPDTVPADVVTFKVAEKDITVDGVTTPIMIAGQIVSAQGGKIIAAGNRIYTKTQFEVDKYEKFVIADGFRCVVHFWGADGTYMGESGWQTGTKAIKSFTAAANAKYFRIVAGDTANSDPFAPADFPAGALTLVQFPEDYVEPEDVIKDGILYPYMASGTVNGAPYTLDTCVSTHATRLYTVTSFAASEIDEIMVASGCRAFVQFFKADKTYSGGSGWIAGPATSKIASLGGYDKDGFFKVTFSSTEGGNDVNTPPADGLTFKVKEKAPEDVIVDGVLTPALVPGTINGAPYKVDTCLGAHATRLATLNTYEIAKFDEIIVGEGIEIFVQFFMEDGTYTAVGAGSGWLTAGTYKVAKLTGAEGATYFRVTYDSSPRGSVPTPGLMTFTLKKEEPKDVIEDGVLTPALVPGTILGKPYTVDTCLIEHPTRLATLNTYETVEFDEINVGEGIEIFVQFFMEDGTYNDGSAWLTAGTYKVAKLTGAKGSKYFRITYDSSPRGSVPTPGLMTFTFAPEPPKDKIEDGILYPGMISGSIPGIPEQGPNIIEHETRFSTYSLLEVDICGRMIIDEGFRAYVHFYGEDGIWLGGSGWQTGTVKVANLSYAAQATYFKVTVDPVTATTSPADALRFTLAAEEVPCEHTYDNDCDKDCNLCGELREVADHVYDNACDKDCNVCGETREVADHVYENYTSNNDATCTADGTKTGTCACGATDTIVDEGSMLDHTYVDYTSNNDATCTADGTKTGTCTCGATDTIVDEGTMLDHTYENYTSNGDATCAANGTETGTCACGATDTREDADSKLPHTYDDEYDAECNECGHIRDAACRHEYDNDCDADCNLCGEIRVVADHVYENYTSNNDATCAANGTETGTCACGATDTREVADSKLDHTYDNACDADCNECGATREVADHVYDNACDANCNVCGAIREVADHVYDNACDTDCNECGATREVGDHVYDNACDADCNNCGETREVADHVYDNACDADCNECGEAREVADHVYDNACDKDCNVCGAIREVADHVYDNACDTDCNVCGATREVGDHVYDDIFDAECNECGNIREVPDKCDHEYDNLCDAECNLCFELREVGDHKYNTEYDVDCNNCGFIREAEGFDVVEIKEVDGKEYIFVDGRTAIKGLFKIGGDYYFSNWGGEIVRDQKAYVKISYCDLPGGKEYTFGADGKLLNGFVEKDGVKYLYFNGITATKGIFKIDGDYYFSDWGGVVKGGTFYTSYIFTEDLTPGEYTFDEEGKMVDGFVEKDGETVLYKTGKVADPGLHEVDGKYYIVTWNGVIRTNGTYFVKESFCDKEANRNLEVGLDGVVTNI